MIALVVLAPVVGLATTPGSVAREADEDWNQLGGSADRGGAVALPSGPVDVMSRYRIHGPSENTTHVVGPRVISTPHGPVGLIREDGTDDCALFHLTDPRTGEVTRSPLETCRSPWLQGYDPVDDAVIACSRGSVETAELQSRDLSTGTLNWGVSPADLGVPASEDDTPWHCSGAAIDVEGGRVVASFLSSNTGADWPRHRIAAVDLGSGEVRWSNQIPAHAASKTGTSHEPVDPSGAGFLPLSVTLTGSGVLTQGLIVCADAARCSEVTVGEPSFVIHNAVAWLEDDGTVTGMQWSHNDPASPSEPTPGQGGGKRSGSLWATASGDSGAIAMGRSLMLIDPRQSAPQASVEIEPTERLTDDYLGWYGPTWSRDTVYVPLTRNLVAVRSEDLQVKWTHQGDFDWRAGDTIATPTGVVYHLAQHRNTTGAAPGSQSSDRSELFLLDAGTGTVLQELPIPLENHYASDPSLGVGESFGGFSWIPTVHMTPLGPDGILILSSNGEAILIGPSPAGEGPPVKVSNRYPGVGETVTLEVPPSVAASVEEVRVVWGDEKDSAETLTTQTPTAALPDGATAATHTYPEPRRYEAVVTMVHEDGTTSSRTVRFDVGGSPPEDPNILEQAFAPEYQDITFGVLGIAVALLGGAIGLARVRRRRNRLQEELEAVEEIARDESNPVRLDAALEERRDHVRDLVLAGKLDESQSQIVQDRIDELAREARMETLDEELGFLPLGIARTLEEMLSDATITRWERERFLDALDGEDRITEDEKARVREVVETWSRRDASTD